MKFQKRELVLENLKGFIKKGSEVGNPTFISTGHFPLDIAITHGILVGDGEFDDKIDLKNPGGFPMGRLVDLHGMEASGKSSLAYRVIGNAQKVGLNCCWIDVEHSFSNSLAEINGVNLNDLYMSDLIDIEDPDRIYFAEDILEYVCKACDSGFQVIVLDSVANLVTKAEMENELGAGGVGMGILAQLMSKAVKKVCNYAAKNNTLVIMINQLRDKIGVMFGNPESTPGGRALKYSSSVRIRMQKMTKKDEGTVSVEQDDGSNIVVAGKSYVSIVKNRFAPPVNDSILIPIYYKKYFPGVEEIIFDVARQTKVVSVRKGVYSWDDIKIEGRKNFIQELVQKNTVSKLVHDIKTVAKQEGILLPPEISLFDSQVVTDDAKVSRHRQKGDRARGEKDSVDKPAERRKTDDGVSEIKEGAE